MTKYFDMKENIDEIELKEASKLIEDGELVIFPTETVYGIGANGLDGEAVKNIFIAKGRAQDNPLILHISDIEMVDKIATDISDMERKIIDIFFPGPLTIILKKKDVVPSIVSGGLDTVGIRMPSNKIANSLIKYANVPIAAPSANISGRPSGTTLDDIKDEFADKVSCMIDGGNTLIGVESTVIRVIDNKIRILRPGKITAEQIRKVAGDVEIDNHILCQIQDGQKILSPGMKYRHYAPTAKCILIYSEHEKNFIEKSKEIAEKYKNPIILTKTENISKIEKIKTIDMGESLEEISKNIFTILRNVDKYNPDIVIIEGVEKQGLGLAIMNRLIRACEYNYIEI